MEETRKMTLNQRTVNGSMPKKKKDIKQINIKDIKALIKDYKK